jgi:hypothetical protein
LRDLKRPRTGHLTNAAFSGSIDRVTGDVQATFIVTNTQTGQIENKANYSLRCKPAQPMF